MTSREQYRGQHPSPMNKGILILNNSQSALLGKFEIKEACAKTRRKRINKMKGNATMFTQAANMQSAKSVRLVDKNIFPNNII